MSQIAAVEAALKASGDKIGRPWSEWYRDDKGRDEVWYLHRDKPLIMVEMDQVVLAALTEDEADLLVEGSDIDAEEFSIDEPSYLTEVYARELPR